MLHALLVIYAVIAIATPLVLHFCVGFYDGMCDVKFEKTLTDAVRDSAFWPTLFLMTVGWPVLAALFLGWAAGRALDTDEAR